MDGNNQTEANTVKRLKNLICSPETSFALWCKRKFSYQLHRQTFV